MRLILVILAVVIAVPLQAQTLVNDLFSNRILLAGMTAASTAYNSSAAKRPGEADHAGSPSGKSLWWAWTAPTSGDLTINTDGSDFDTVLGVNDNVIFGLKRAFHLTLG